MYFPAMFGALRVVSQWPFSSTGTVVSTWPDACSMRTEEFGWDFPETVTFSERSELKCDSAVSGATFRSTGTS